MTRLFRTSRVATHNNKRERAFACGRIVGVDRERKMFNLSVPHAGIDAGRFVVLTLCSLAIAACGGGGGGSANPPAPPLAIAPSTLTMDPGTTRTFSATGGLAPYTFSVASGGGLIDTSSGLFTADRKSVV